MNKPKMWTAAVIVVTPAYTAQSATIYVDDDNCPGPGSGTEADPYCSIQTAIDNAGDTDEIVVAPGTYNEMMITFLGKAVTLRSSDGPEVTIIDAWGGPTVVACESGEGPDTVLDGFTLTGGDACACWQHAGGMTNRGSSPTVTNCIITGNTAGGGMLNDQSSPTVTDCVFSGNVPGVVSGGAALDYDCCMAHPWPGCDLPEGCEDIICAMDPYCCDTQWDQICADAAHEYCMCECHAHCGGGMRNVDGSNPTVTGCTFSGNSAGDYGGGMSNEDSNPTVIDCTFSDNDAVCGGGMYNDGSSPTVSNCTFSENDSGWGGGMYNSGGNPTVTGCTFSGNEASVGDGGGGMYNDNASPTVADSAFCDNTPDHIVGEYVDGGGNEFCPLCAGDVTGDGIVSVEDFLELLAFWGECPDPPATCFADLDGDGAVGVLDFLLLLNYWGPCP